MEADTMAGVSGNQHWTDAGAEAALERGCEKMHTEPRASSARYDRKSQRIIVELTSGATFGFPPTLVEGLCDGTPEQLAEI